MVLSDESGPALDLPADVTKRVVAELPGRGEKVVAALQTAAYLLSAAVHHDAGLRLAESATYNLREALDAVVSGLTPAEGGLPAVLAAWQQYEQEAGQPGNDNAISLQVFSQVIRRAGEQQDRNSYHEARLLGYLRDKSGVEPLVGELDPVAEYKRLRKRANRGVHTSTNLGDASILYQQTMAWFVRMFTPPADVVVALRELAAEPWTGPDQISRLHRLASNPNQLRLFFVHLKDAAWLEPLYGAGMVPPPQPESPWPVYGLLEGLGRTEPVAVASVVQKMLRACKQLPADQQLGARFDLLRFAVNLGQEGHGIVGDIAKLHPNNDAVRSLATTAVKDADPTAPIVEKVASAVLNAAATDRDAYYYKLLLNAIENGMTADNAVRRTRLLIAKLRAAAQGHAVGRINIDIARLNTELGDDDRQFLVVAAHYLARILARALAFGVPGTQLWTWVATIPGEVGERLVCRVLVLAEDVPLEDKIKYVTLRLGSDTVSGDDKDLVDAVLAANPAPTRLQEWSAVLGKPSAASENIAAPPRDWLKAWRWSTVLPGYMLTDWQPVISTLSRKHGRFDETCFSCRLPTFIRSSESSPYSVDQLAAYTPLEAARLVSQWRPDTTADYNMTTPRGLARALETVVAANLPDWIQDPVAMVTMLREPVYVLHYLRSIAENVEGISEQTDQIIEAARVATIERWAPNTLSRDRFDFESDWAVVDIGALDLVTKLADRNSVFTQAALDDAWSLILSALETSPEEPATTTDIARSRTVSGKFGRGLQAAISFAAWEERNNPPIRAQFFNLLDEALKPTSRVGLESRAILAWQRPRLEYIAHDWLNQRVDLVFRDAEYGTPTIDLTLEIGRPTPWLLRNLRDDLVSAALRGAENAVGHLLVGTLHDEPGYDSGAVITTLRSAPQVLAEAAAEMARLVQNDPAGSQDLDTALGFWRSLLDADRATAPAEVIYKTGRWSYVTGVPDDVWTQLTIRTLEITNGNIEYAIQVADRCKTVTVPDRSTKILLMLQDRGEPWERYHAAEAAMDALRALSTTRSDTNFLALQTRLIELGRHEAIDVAPYNCEAPPRA
ncbi:hypothetical protein ACFYT3_35155 [Nocardia amikacinitolerans]|uniref:hypothetical protein n=1 Tax=Nocardia amikacinitolerans TaxID=756689 RepID=UPI0036948644